MGRPPTNSHHPASRGCHGAHSHASAVQARHGAANRNRRRLIGVLCLTLGYMVAEAIGGWWTGSLALIADAGHMATDAGALGFAVAASWIASRPATARKTFGFHRAEILAALANGGALILLAFIILFEAHERWLEPPVVASGQMLLIAIGGLIVNLVSARVLHGGHDTDLNVRGAWLHVLGDALGSVGAIAAGAVMHVYGWYRADAMVSATIALLLAVSSWRLIREAANVLLEGVPSHISLAAVEAAFLEEAGVEDVHDLHVWTLTSGRDALSAHVVHSPAVSSAHVLANLRKRIRDRFGIDHMTIQMELSDWLDEGLHACHANTRCFGSQDGETRRKRLCMMCAEPS